MAPESYPQMAFIGIGKLGKAMSSRLARHIQGRSPPLILYNRTYGAAADQADALGELARAVSSIQEAIQPSAIIWSTAAPDAPEQTSLYDQMLAGDIAGKLFIDCSTNSVDTTKLLTEKMAKRGADFLAMPVFGTPEMAADGHVLVAPAGPAALVKRITPFLRGVMASDVIDFSDEPQWKAVLFKTIGVVNMATTMEQCAEMMVLADKTGLGMENMRKLYAALYPGGEIKQHMAYSGSMASGNWQDHPPVATVDAAITLTDRVSHMAQQHGVQLKAFDVFRQHLQKARALGGGEQDIIAIYGVNRVEAGLTYAGD